MFRRTFCIFVNYKDMNSSFRHRGGWLLVTVIAILVWGCAAQRRLSRLGAEPVQISLPQEADFLPDQVAGIHFEHADTVYVKGEDGKDLILL